MALALSVDKIDTLPENVRELYTEKDGKFVLDVEGIEDTAGLKNALEAERKNAREAGKLAKAYRDLGMSADDIKALVAEKQERERKEAEKAGNFEALRKQDREGYEKDLAARQDRIAALEKTTRQAVVGNQLMAALTKAGASQEGIDLLPDRLSARVKFEFDGDNYRHSVMLDDGETPMAGSGKDGNATFDDLVKEATDKWPSLFKGAGAAGGGKLPGSAGGAGKRKMTLVEFAALPPKEQAARMAEGVDLT